MSQRDVEVIALSQRIAEAFAKRPAPSRKSMVYAGSWETGDLIGNLAKVEDIPTDQFIEWHADSLPVFTPEGLRHVVPYYMQYTLQHPRSEAAERLIFHLSPTETEDDYWRPRLAVFSQAQKEAICALFTFLEKDLQGDHYEWHFSRARVVWGCSLASSRTANRIQPAEPFVEAVPTGAVLVHQPSLALRASFGSVNQLAHE